MKKYFLKYKNHIILDYLESWPKELIDFLGNNKELFKAYNRIEQLIDESAIEDVNLRIWRPVNPYREEWDAKITELLMILKKNRYLGFHCTRLIDVEIDDILANGLLPLSTELVKIKLNNLLKNGLIDFTIYRDYLDNHLGNHEYRKNRVFTFHTLQTLSNDYGLSRLLRCWGGEAFYVNKEQNEHFKSVFFNIGKATVIVTSHDFSEIDKHDIEKRIIDNYLYGITENRGSDFDNWHNKTVQVLDCITEDNELFNSFLTYTRDD